MKTTREIARNQSSGPHPLLSAPPPSVSTARLPSSQDDPPPLHHCTLQAMGLALAPFVLSVPPPVQSQSQSQSQSQPRGQESAEWWQELRRGEKGGTVKTRTWQGNKADGKTAPR